MPWPNSQRKGLTTHLRLFGMGVRDLITDDEVRSSYADRRKNHKVPEKDAATCSTAAATPPRGCIRTRRLLSNPQKIARNNMYQAEMGPDETVGQYTSKSG